MSSFPRRTVYYLLVLVAATGVFASVYSLGMSVWEGRPQSWYQSLEVVVQTFTTTGYGEDAPWQSPQMNLLVIVLQLVGIGFLLSAVDVFVVPWLQEDLRPRAPTALSDRSGQVLVCGYTPRVEVFVEKMEERGQEYALIVSETDRAGALYEEGYRVMEGDPTATDTLEKAHVGAARVLVADVTDDENASIALAAREADPEGRVITLVEDASLARYHQAAGADLALSPRQLLGQSLAARVPLAAAANVETSVADRDDVTLAEILVTRHSPLHGRTLAETDLSARFGVRVIGAWFEDSFQTSIAPDTVLEEPTRLFVAGTADQLADLREDMAASVRAFTPQSILLAGYGDSGHAVADSLRQAQAEVTVMDVEDREGVDVVGDVRDPDVLKAAGIETASTLITAADGDTVATFATLIARDLNPDLQILVRNHEESAVRNLYRAGANFAQALPVVCGRMLATTVFDEDGRPTQGRHVNVVRLFVPALSGGVLEDMDTDSQTNHTVLAVRRGDTFLTDTDDEAFALEEGDEVIVAGTDDGIQQFRDRLTEASESS
jgi:Trk K+ transport system NAD-binding subunit